MYLPINTSSDHYMYVHTPQHILCTFNKISFRFSFQQKIGFRFRSLHLGDIFRTIVYCADETYGLKIDHNAIKIIVFIFAPHVAFLKLNKNMITDKFY
jgi:hypothetical protein